MSIGIPKPQRADRKAAKHQVERVQRKTRAVVRKIVYLRERGTCERCRIAVSFDVYAWADNRAEVHEEPPRSLGGDPYDPDQCHLLCRKCHQSGPSGSHITRQQMSGRR